MQRLARQAVRDVRRAVAGPLVPSFQTELAAAEAALHATGVAVNTDVGSVRIDPSRESTITWALREALTNVVKRSGARTCRISVHGVDRLPTLKFMKTAAALAMARSELVSAGLRTVHAWGGTLRVERRERQAFRLSVQLGSVARTPPNGVHVG